MTTQPDIWTELKEQRDMLVQQRLEVRNMGSRVTASESQGEELKRQRNQLTSYNNLTKERDQLQKETEMLNKKITGRHCPQGWREFEISFTEGIRKWVDRTPLNTATKEQTRNVESLHMLHQVKDIGMMRNVPLNKKGSIQSQFFWGLDQDDHKLLLLRNYGSPVVHGDHPELERPPQFLGDVVITNGILKGQDLVEGLLLHGGQVPQMWRQVFVVEALSKGINLDLLQRSGQSLLDPIQLLLYKLDTPIQGSHLSLCLFGERTLSQLE
ncbi:unnamed protein product, partial [Coregonus sp. 'balchen']